jgi:hypothetical protein
MPSGNHPMNDLDDIVNIIFEGEISNQFFDNTHSNIQTEVYTKKKKKKNKVSGFSMPEKPKPTIYKSPIIKSDTQSLKSNGPYIIKLDKPIEFTLKIDICDIWNNIEKYMIIPNKYLDKNPDNKIYKLKVNLKYQKIKYIDYTTNNQSTKPQHTQHKQHTQHTQHTDTPQTEIINISIVDKYHNKYRRKVNSYDLETYCIITSLNNHDLYIDLPNKTAIKIHWNKLSSIGIIKNYGFINPDNDKRGNLIVYFMYNIQNKLFNSIPTDINTDIDIDKETYTDVIYPDLNNEIEELWNKDITKNVCYVNLFENIF